MIAEGIKFIIDRSMPHYRIDIWAIDFRSDGRYFITSEKGDLTYTKVNEGELGGKPLLNIPPEMLNELFTAMDRYRKENHMREPEASFKDGELVATKGHLEEAKSILHQLLDYVTKKK